MKKNLLSTSALIKRCRTVMLFCAVFWAVLVKADAQHNNLKAERLDSYLKKIEKAYKVSFVYDAAEIDKSTIVYVSEPLSSVQQSLEALKAANIGYRMMNNQVILKMQPVPVAVSHKKTITVKGTVSDSKDGIGIPGVSISVKGTNTVIASNAQGQYQINVDDRATLVFRYVGYKTQEVAVIGRNHIDVQLEVDISQLKEVVVSTGYQNVSKRLFTGAAATVKGSEVKQDGVTDISRMLEGRVAGVSVQNVSGTFGTAPKIRVRGATSITGENKPLWVIDGVVLEDIVNISNDQLSNGDATTLIGSSIAGINADDIESINILKDASATALYGARAMNGVVVLTTKKGKAGNTTISYNGNFSTFLKPSYSTYNIMNSADQMSVYAEVYRKGGLSPNIVNGMNGGVFAKMYKEINRYDATAGQFGVANTPEGRAAFLQKYATANTDWFNVLFRNSFVQEHSLSIQSGSEKSQHYFSLGYYNDQGWTVADKAKRYTMNLRGNYNLSPKLSIGILATGSFRQQRVPGTLGRTSNVVEGTYTRDFDTNPFSYALNTSRTLRAYDDNGNREYFTRFYAPFNILNELDNNWIDLDMIDSKLQGELNYKFLKNFEFKSIAALRYVKTTREHKITEFSNMAIAYRYAPNSTIANANIFLYDDPDYPAVIDPVSVLPQGGFYNRSDDNLANYNIRNQLDWKQNFGKDHSVSAFIGQEIKFSNRQSSFNNGYGYQYDKGGRPFTDYRIIKMLLEGNYNYYGMDQFYDRYAAFFANASYGYKSRYIINGTYRYDGGNKLGTSRTARWLPTWTVSGAWNIDEENFIKNLNVFSLLKLRGGYGLTASMGSASNSSIRLLNSTTLRPVLSETEPRITLSNLENSELTWEKQYETNVGLDVGLFQSRLNVTVDYYRRNGFDLIGAIRTSGIGGEQTKLANYADMQSRGIEFNIGGTPVKSSSFSWQTNLTFGYNKNTITNLKSKPRIYDLIIPEGGPREGGAVRGLYSIDFKKLNEVGVPYFTNENGVVSNNVYVQSDLTSVLKYEGTVDPTTTGGLSNTFRYKGFSFSFFVSYQAGNKIRLNNVYRTNYTDNDAMPREFLDRWTLPLDENTTNSPSIADYLLKKALTGTYPYTAYNYSSDRVADGSFVRLKQAFLMYNFPVNFAKAIGVKTASLKLQGNNIWLIYADKKLKGQDPEFFASGGVALPIPRQMTVTVKLGF